MTIKLNHTIVLSRDKRASATFFTELFGLPPAVPLGIFLGVPVANEITLDFVDYPGQITAQHYAFLVSEQDFDQIFGRIEQQKLAHWADPRKKEPNQINTHDGGRGVYFEDPSGHYLEIITRPYGSGKP